MIHQMKYLMWSLFTEVLFLQHIKAEQRELSGRVTCCLMHGCTGMVRSKGMWGRRQKHALQLGICTPSGDVDYWGLLSELCNPGRLDFCKADKCGCGGIVT